MAAALRAFFAERGVLEVETPLLGAATTPEPHLASPVVTEDGTGTEDGNGGTGDAAPPRRYLQTSPELHMKRLLAAGSGPIFQLARVARGGERGRLHNPEFTLLEWYRPGWDHHRLMDEVEELVRRLLAVGGRSGGGAAGRSTYRDLFRRHLDLDPFAAGTAELDTAVAAVLGLTPGAGATAAPTFAADDRDGRLALLLTHGIEPRLPRGLIFVHDFPASQASLARVRREPGGTEVAERFELYVDGIELANGFHELTDPAEQRRRFVRDVAARRRLGLPAVPIDERFLASLDAGLPACAGVALGFDRLVMCALGAASIDAVIAFPAPRA